MESNQTTGALNVATAAALEAGKIIIQNITQLDRVKVNEKSGQGQNRKELVSEIDLLAEKTIIEQLDAAYPEYNIISEEAGDLGRKSEFCWIIDPMDGTHSVIYDAIRNKLFTARKGAGAQLDGRRIRVSQVSKLTDSLLCTGFPYRQGAETKLWLRTFAAIMPRAQSIHRTGSSVLDMAYVACGRYDGFWEMGLKEWDIAAGSLMIKEAGGMVTNIDGNTDAFKSGNVVAGNPKVHEKIQHILNNV